MIKIKKTKIVSKNERLLHSYKVVRFHGRNLKVTVNERVSHMVSIAFVDNGNYFFGLDPTMMTAGFNSNSVKHYIEKENTFNNFCC